MLEMNLRLEGPREREGERLHLLEEGWSKCPWDFSWEGSRMGSRAQMGRRGINVVKFAMAEDGEGEESNQDFFYWIYFGLFRAETLQLRLELAPTSGLRK